jgi:hypothetical protein
MNILLAKPDIGGMVFTGVNLKILWIVERGGSGSVLELAVVAKAEVAYTYGA